MWIQNLERNKLQRSMKAFTKLLKSKRRKALEPFVNYVLKKYYNGLDKYGNQVDESSREESFERRWNTARAILLRANDFSRKAHTHQEWEESEVKLFSRQGFPERLLIRLQKLTGVVLIRRNEVEETCSKWLDYLF
tara:strand:- start:202 stop:609 length:408 start_codon:yes stop_codon:yes gene_type:complete